MPAPNTTDEASVPDYLSADSSASRVSVSTQQPESRSTTSTSRPPRRDSQDVIKSHHIERESKKSQANYELPDATPSVIATTTTAASTNQRSLPSSADRYDARSGFSGHPEGTSDSDSSDSSSSFEQVPADREWSGISKAPGSKMTRVQLTSQPTSHAQGAVTGRSSKDPQYPPGMSESSAPRVNAATHPSTEKHRNAQAVPGHFPQDEQQGMSEIRQQPSQGVMGTILSYIPVAGPQNPQDKYQLLKDDYRRLKYESKQAHAELDAYKFELQRTHGELRSAKHYINGLHHERQRWKDHVGGLQNELSNVHQHLDEARTLSEVRGKELFGAQVFLTKADTLSISEVGEKVIALNEEIFQAAATLGEVLIHGRHELPQGEFDAAAAESGEMVGEKISNILISQAQKPEREVNPLLVQVVLQIFMVKFCVSKIQSWYPSDPAIAAFLNAIYSDIRSAEEQAVSGRWRALTRAHTRPTTETWTTELSRKLMSVFRIAAWKPVTAENGESFVHRLPPIFKAVNEVRMALSEKFTSADLDASIFDSDVVYEPSRMEDAYSDGRQLSGKRAPEVIIGTTGIGLKKLMSERGAKDTIQFENVISAKIVLESTLKEALEPVQSSSKSRRTKKPANIDAPADPEGRGSFKQSKHGFIDV